MSTSAAVLTWAHPRTGGENPATARRIVCQVGSSPRGRGKLARMLNLIPISRLIPARAGKTWSRRRRHRHLRAHPRAGGENQER